VRLGIGGRERFLLGVCIVLIWRELVVDRRLCGVTGDEADKIIDWVGVAFGDRGMAGGFDVFVLYVAMTCFMSSSMLDGFKHVSGAGEA